jgi:hypothetical protein
MIHIFKADENYQRHSSAMLKGTYMTMPSLGSLQNNHGCQMEGNETRWFGGSNAISKRKETRSSLTGQWVTDRWRDKQMKYRRECVNQSACT